MKSKVAIVGCGVISDIYFQNLSTKFSNAEVVACADLDTAKAEEKAAKYGVKVMTTKEIIADDSIRMVVNLTTPNAHYPVIKELLEGGKNVYTEKPFAVSMAEADELSRIADEKGLALCSAPDTFLGSACQTGRFIVDSGLIGTPTSAVAVLNRDGGLMADKYPYTGKKNGGIGPDVGVYYLTEMLSIMGPVASCCGYSEVSRPERIHSLVSRPGFGTGYAIESDNLVSASFRFSSGAFGSLHLNADSTQDEMPYLTIYGTEGILYLPDPNKFGGEVRLQLKGQTEPIVFPPTHAYSGNSRGLGVSEALWALDHGRRPRTSKEMAYHVLELIYGVEESSRTHVYHEMKSTFTRPDPIPRGFLDEGYHGATEEAGLFF